MTVQSRGEVTASEDGTSIGCVRLGTGPALVLVHGAWVGTDAWLPVAERLADRFSCSVMDRRGRGRSGDGTDYSLDHEVADIAAVLDAAGPDASLLGHSSGAIYVLEAARRAPVGRLVLYEPPLRWNSRWESILNRFRDHLDAEDPEAAATLFFREEAQLSEDDLSALRSSPHWPVMTARAWLCLREWDAIRDAGLQVDRYRDLSVPTLLLAGTETDDHPTFATHQLEQVLPNARTEMLDGQGHMAHQAVPDAVARVVSRFLS